MRSWLAPSRTRHELVVHRTFPFRSTEPVAGRMALVAASLILSSLLWASSACGASVWIDADADGLPDSDTLAIEVGEPLTISIWIDSESFSWTSFQVYVQYDTNLTVDSAYYSVSGGVLFPIDDFSQPEVIGLAGLGYDEAGPILLGQMLVHATSDGFARVDALVDSTSEPLSALGTPSSYALFTESDPCLLQPAINPLVPDEPYASDEVTYPQPPPTLPATLEVVDATGDVGEFASLDLNCNDEPCISYYDRTNGNLKFAVRSWSGWTTETVDGASADVGRYTSVAVSNRSDCYYHIAYHDETNGNLKYAVRSPLGAWSTLTIDAGTPSSADVGETCAIEERVTPVSMSMRIAYYDRTNGDLKLATPASPSSIIETVHGGAVDVGAYPSIATTYNGRELMSYVDLTLNAVLYAYRDGSVWQRTAIEETSNRVLYTGLAIGSDSFPQVVWHDNTTIDLKYAKLTSPTTWTVETVDSPTELYMGDGLSLALDANDSPWVVYREGSGPEDRLAVAHKTGDEWLLQTVDDGATGFVGSFTGLKIDAAGNAHVAYYDRTNLNLRYARIENPVGVGRGLTDATELRVVPTVTTDGRLEVYHGLPLGRRLAATVFDVSGRAILDVALSSGIGTHGASPLVLRNEEGRALAPGVYLVGLKVDGAMMGVSRVVVVR